MQAPHCAMPQPNFVPVSPSTSRSTQRSGMSSGAGTSCSLPLTLSFMAASSLPSTSRRVTASPAPRPPRARRCRRGRSYPRAWPPCGARRRRRKGWTRYSRPTPRRPPREAARRDLVEPDGPLFPSGWYNSGARHRTIRAAAHEGCREAPPRYGDRALSGRRFEIMHYFKTDPPVPQTYPAWSVHQVHRVKVVTPFRMSKDAPSLLVETGLVERFPASTPHFRRTPNVRCASLTPRVP